MKVQNFFFTFGMGDNQPFRGGWVKVIARNRKEAIEVFREEYPDHTRGVLNCADCYNESEFEALGIAERGNFGKSQQGKTLFCGLFL